MTSALIANCCSAVYLNIAAVQALGWYYFGGSRWNRNVFFFRVDSLHASLNRQSACQALYFERRLSLGYPLEIYIYYYYMVSEHKVPRYVFKTHAQEMDLKRSAGYQMGQRSRKYFGVSPMRRSRLRVMPWKMETIFLRD